MLLKMRYTCTCARSVETAHYFVAMSLFFSLPLTFQHSGYTLSLSQLENWHLISALCSQTNQPGMSMESRASKGGLLKIETQVLKFFPEHVVLKRHIYRASEGPHLRQGTWESWFRSKGPWESAGISLCVTLHSLRHSSRLTW